MDLSKWANNYKNHSYSILLVLKKTNVSYINIPEFIKLERHYKILLSSWCFYTECHNCTVEASKRAC